MVGPESLGSSALVLLLCFVITSDSLSLTPAPYLSWIINPGLA